MFSKNTSEIKRKKRKKGIDPVILECPPFCIGLITSFFNSGTDVFNLLLTCKHFSDILHSPNVETCVNVVFMWNMKFNGVWSIRNSLPFVHKIHVRWELRHPHPIKGCDRRLPCGDDYNVSGYWDKQEIGPRNLLEFFLHKVPKMKSIHFSEHHISENTQGCQCDNWKIVEHDLFSECLDYFFETLTNEYSVILKRVKSLSFQMQTIRIGDYIRSFSSLSHLSCGFGDVGDYDLQVLNSIESFTLRPRHEKCACVEIVMGQLGVNGLNSISRYGKLKRLSLDLSGMKLIDSRTQDFNGRSLAEVELLGIQEENALFVYNFLQVLPVLNTLRLHGKVQSLDVLLPCVGEKDLLRHLNVSSMRLSKESIVIFPNLQSLDISSCKIKDFEEGDFRYWSELEVLNMRDGYFPSLKKSSFVFDIPKLKVLEIGVSDPSRVFGNEVPFADAKLLEYFQERPKKKLLLACCNSSFTGSNVRKSVEIMKATMGGTTIICKNCGETKLQEALLSCILCGESGFQVATEKDSMAHCSSCGGAVCTDPDCSVECSKCCKRFCESPCFGTGGKYFRCMECEPPEEESDSESE